MWDLLDDLGQASPVTGYDLDLVLYRHGAERPHPCKPVPGCFPSAWGRILGQNLVKFLAVKKQPAKLRNGLLKYTQSLAVCTVAL